MSSFSPRREKEEERIYVSEINQISDLIISQYPSLRFARLGKKNDKKTIGDHTLQGSIYAPGSRL
jgi:hypothetical protein